MACQKNFGPPKILILDQNFHINFGLGPKFLKKFSPTQTIIFEKIGSGLKNWSVQLFLPFSCFAAILCITMNYLLFLGQYINCRDIILQLIIH